ncbi:MAG: carbamoyl phosphate synthase small subunit [Clostridiales bacterium]|jgi:carbamoyl-phosphate synthase small subunit|nr:carbamoyl phosphate synthase small subunit [Clostridiales bacterium]
MNNLYLILEDGTVFTGKPFGYKADVTAEVVFTTGMTGYLETLTDPSYRGQIVVQTFPLIGNYGVIPGDFESAKIHASGYVVKEWCAAPSNFRSEGDISALLKRKKIPGLYGIDTRALTKIIREHGVMNGRIASDPKSVDLDEIKAYRVENSVAGASVKKAYAVKPDKVLYKTALLDFGLKENIVRELVKRGCAVTVFPHDTKPEEILSRKFDGIMLSNGPGDPADNAGVIENLKKLAASGTPIFGICLGHQLLALSAGFKTGKLKYGHRGANQPVKDLATGRVYITSQNHGYAVLSDTIDPRIGTEAFRNVNDGTCEGVDYKGVPVFSAQFHPEGCGGPQDTGFLFDRFVENMKKGIEN